MRTLTAAVYLLFFCGTDWAHAAGETDDFIQVDCTDNNAATLKIQDPGYTLTGGGNGCLKKVDGQNYKLQSPCFGNTHTTPAFIVMKEHSGNVIESAAGLRVFTVACNEKKNFYVANVQPINVAKVDINNPKPYNIEVDLKQKTGLDLILKKDRPETNSVDDVATLKGNQAQSATLGETLYLMFVDATKNDVIIPQMCNASASGENVILWQLDTRTRKCIQEKNILSGQFTSAVTNDNSGYTSIEMSAFRFTKNPDKAITIACTVKVCSDGDKTECNQGKTALGLCDKSQRRRRRETHDMVPTHGHVHHVAATLRVFEDPFLQTTGGSATLTITLPCLLVSLLVKIIL